MLITIHVDKYFTGQEVIYRIFCIEPIESLTDISRILVIGNLKLVKCIDFWLPSVEATYRIVSDTDLHFISDLVGKSIHVEAAGGRVLRLTVVDDKRRFLRSLLPVLATRPIGVRVLDDYVSLAVSETMYVIAPCRDSNLDIKFFLGKVREFIVGASIKNFFKNLHKLKTLSEQGLLGKKKVSLEADFVVPLTDLMRTLNLQEEENPEKQYE